MLAGVFGLGFLLEKCLGSLGVALLVWWCGVVLLWGGCLYFVFLLLAGGGVGGASFLGEVVVLSA